MLKEVAKIAFAVILANIATKLAIKYVPGASTLIG
jgi:hypothetical protein